ncbi:MAG: hypothetical protein P8Y85_04835 [Nitrospirota bacterium]|jgi:tetratricopeptide (TPR) repeat protein
MKNTPRHSARAAVAAYLTITALFTALFVSQACAAQGESDEYALFGRRIVADLSGGDARAFGDAIDKEALIARVMEGVPQDSKAMGELREGLMAGLDRVGAMVTGNLGENALLTFVRHRRMEGGDYALVRIDYGEKGLNYLDFVLRKNAAGAVKIIDWHDYAQGQLYTASLRQAIALLIPQDRTLFEKLLGVDGLDKKEAKQFVELARLLREKDFSGWLKKYDSLSEKMKSSRILLVTHVLAASASGDNEQYRLALGDVRNHLGDDPTLSLVLIDYYFYEEDYRAAQRALERMTGYTGGDAAIDHLRANIYLAAKNYADSIRYARKAIEEDAAYEDSYWTLLDASVLTGQYQEAVGVIGQLETRFGYEFDPAKLAEIDGYEGFAESSAFAEWKGVR